MNKTARYQATVDGKNLMPAVVLLAVVCGLLAAQVMWLYTGRRRQRIDNRLASNREQLSEARRRMEWFREQGSKERREATELLEAYPHRFRESERPFSDIARRLVSLAADFEVSVEEISPAASPAAGWMTVRGRRFQPFAVRLILTGEDAELINYLRKLQDNDEWAAFREIDMRQTGENRWTLEAVLEWPLPAHE